MSGNLQSSEHFDESTAYGAAARVLVPLQVIEHALYTSRTYLLCTPAPLICFCATDFQCDAANALRVPLISAKVAADMLYVMFVHRLLKQSRFQKTSQHFTTSC